MGAEIIEKHVTIDRRMKGSDHSCSLGPDGVVRMMRDIRLLDLSIGEKGMFVADGVEQAKQKLQRSVATLHEVKKGETISEADIQLLSPGDGFCWADRADVVGRVAAIDIPANEIVYGEMLTD